MKTQAENLQAEYDRLADQLTKLEVRSIHHEAAL